MSLPAELNLATVPGLLPQAAALAAAGELDLSGVRSVDSAGLAFLLELQRRARAAGGSLRLRGAGDRVRRLAVFFELEPLLDLA